MSSRRRKPNRIAGMFLLAAMWILGSARGAGRA